MKFKETLRLARKNNILSCDLLIAEEFEDTLHFKYTDSEFEGLCICARDASLEIKSITAEALALCINDLVKKKGYTIQQVCGMRSRALADKAQQFMD